MKNEILESLRPWDCEIFDKDICLPFICFGGGGGVPKPLRAKPLPSVNLGTINTDQDLSGGAKLDLTPNRHLTGGANQLHSNLDLGLGSESGFGRTMQGAGEGMMNEISSGIDRFGKNVDEFVERNTRDLRGGGGGDDDEGESSSANYSTGSSSKGKAAGSKAGRLGKNREKLAKRSALKVRQK